MLMPPISRYATRSICTVSPDDRMIRAHDLMRDQRIRHLPVVDAGQLVGIVTDRDLRLVVPAAGADPDEVPVRAVMSAHPIAVLPGDLLDTVVARMTELRANAAVVVGKDGVEGIFTTVDALDALYDLLQRATA